MEFTGKIKEIFPEEQVSASFVKRDIVITTDEQYPQDILVQFVQDKVDILDAYKAGQDVTVSYNLRGREWINPEGVKKYFNTIQGWRIQKVRTEAAAEQPAAAQQAAPPAAQQTAANFEAPDDFNEEDGPDLPF